MSNRAWVTLATNDSYGLGALVLAHSLRRVVSAAPAVVLITPAVTEAMRERLGAVFAEVISVDVLDSGDAAHLALLQRPELGITFTKLHCWNLTQYDKCVFLDADTLIVQNCDELFGREELSAAPDVGWPDCFNSGVFVFKPSADTFSNLIKFAQERGSFDGGDQGLLNAYFSDWAHGDINKHLPFLYNVTSAAFYSYIPALKQYGQNLKIIHFIGASKPWLQHYNWRTHSVEAPEHLRDFLQLWWSLFVAEVHSKLDTSMVEKGQAPPAITQHQLEHVDSGLNTGHYEAKLDPQSQFPWHHPDNQIQNSAGNESVIDMAQFHDPWDVYRGNIPPSTEESNGEGQPREDYQDVRKYAWDYMPPQYDHRHNDHAPTQIESPCHEIQPFQDLSHNAYNFGNQPTEIHQQYIENNRQENARTDTNEHQRFKEYIQHDNKQFHKNHNPTHNTSQNHNFEPLSVSKYRHNENLSSHKETYHHEPQSYKERPNVQTDTLHNSYDDHKKIEQVVFSHPGELGLNREIAKNAYSVHTDHQYKNEDNLDPNLNGYFSDEENETRDESRPRHPYDGFYLRHRNTIDSRGKKICSHEIPYFLSSPTPTPCSPEIFEDALTLTEDTNKINGDKHTGVAGHLARVGEGFESDAIDELTRRQGWEAGNIDYMGADSFDKIWAKISRTLSQAPSPPTKQQSPPVESVVISKDVDTMKPKEKPKEVLPAISSAAPELSVKAKESSSIEEPIPVPVEAAARGVPSTPKKVSVSDDKTVKGSDVPVFALEALDLDEQSSGSPISDVTTSQSDPDSPPLVTTPAKEAAPTVPVTKTEERRKPVGKLQLHPPSAADPLPTPDSEFEDAATLAQSIIASEMRTPTITSPSPTTEPPCRPVHTQPSCLSVQKPEVPTPPVGAVSLSQIGIKPKTKPTIAAQIESSVSPKTESTLETPTASALSTPSESGAPKKKLVKKAPKKEVDGSSSGEAPVPPPRKKEKKPKEK